MNQGNKPYARGAVLGLAVGDALGTTLEFSRPIQADWSPLLTGLHTDILGGGPFGVLPGQVTDDTMMACCLASSLHACEGLDPDDIGRRYVDWYGVTFDCGSQTSQSLSGIRGGESAETAGKTVWMRGGRNAAGNGSLMRTAPIGVYFSGSLMDIVSASVLDSNITHFDPRCSLACAALNAAIGLAASSLVPISPSTALGEAKKGLHMAAGYLLGRHPDIATEIESAYEVLLLDLASAQQDDPGLYGTGPHLHAHQGFVRVAFRLAFWELLHAPTFKAGLTDCVNRGGDSDTNGAIAGSLLGAVYGEDSIPPEWRAVVLNCNPSAPFHGAGALHPRRLLEMVESL
jgi:ADP-ribosyl-[dinitrogen reductase] hydrolase